MKIPDDLLMATVSDAAARLSDPDYSAICVGSLVESQPYLAQYIGAHADEFGGTEKTVHVIFHAALIARCFEKQRGRSLPILTFEDLHDATDPDPREQLPLRQPGVHQYIQDNVDSEAMSKILALITIALDRSR